MSRSRLTPGVARRRGSRRCRTAATSARAHRSAACRATARRTSRACGPARRRRGARRLRDDVVVGLRARDSAPRPWRRLARARSRSGRAGGVGTTSASAGVKTPTTMAVALRRLGRGPLQAHDLVAVRRPPAPGRVRSARPRLSRASTAQRTYQGTRTSALPSTTNRGSSASPTKSCTTETASDANAAAATDARNALRRVRGCSGSPKAYAVRHSSTDVAQRPGEPGGSRPRVPVFDRVQPCSSPRRRPPCRGRAPGARADSRLRSSARRALRLARTTSIRAGGSGATEGRHLEVEIRAGGTAPFRCRPADSRRSPVGS